MSKIKEYTNGEITVVWKPETCIHSAVCAKNLPNVFDPRARPWIKMDGDSSKKIMEIINKCPSGALSYYKNDAKKENPSPTENLIIEVTENGPLLVKGNMILKESNGDEIQCQKITALCRCGASQNKPYCDGKHKKIAFEG